MTQCEIISNVFYCPKFIDEILKVFIPFLSLWTDILPVKRSAFDNSKYKPTHFTNASIESFFGELKLNCYSNSVCIGKTSLKVGRYLEFSTKLTDDKAYKYLNSILRIPKVNQTRNKQQAQEIDPIEFWKSPRHSKLTKNLIHFTARTVQKKITEDYETEDTIYGDDNHSENKKFSNNLLNDAEYYSTLYTIKEEYVDYVVSLHNSEKLKYSTYNSVAGENWLENTILDILYLSLKERNERIQLEKFYMCSFLQLLNTKDFELKMLADSFILTITILIIPIFHSQHFYACIIDYNKKEFTIIDSGVTENKDQRESAERRFNILYQNFDLFSNYYNQMQSKTLQIPTNLKKEFLLNRNKANKF